MKKSINERSGSCITPFEENQSIRIYLEGPPRDWKKVVADHEALTMYAEKLESYKVFVPRLSLSTGMLAKECRFKKKFINGSLVLGDVDTDGTTLREGDSIAMATGDCPTVVFWTPERSNRTVVVHAGRKSVLSGVIYNAVRKLGCSKKTMHLINVYIVLGIGPKHFDHPMNHPEYGEANVRMIDKICRTYSDRCFSDLKKGCLDLSELIASQCTRAGIPRDNVVHDGRDTFSDRLPDGSYAWYSNRRGDRSRNLVFVQNR